jgi:hypothetical protein
MSIVDSEIDKIAQKILLELETASSKDLSDAGYARKILHLSDVHYTKKILQQIGTISAHSPTESEIGKRAVIKVLLLSTWLQKLYFIIRAFLMGEIASVITFLVIWYLGVINYIQNFILGFFVFIFSLAVTRLFDEQLAKATRKIVEILAGHRRSRDFIMNHF